MLGTIIIIIALFSFALGVFVLRNNWKRPTNYLFFLLSVFISLWIVSNLLVDSFNSITWSRLTYSFGALLPSTAWLWSLYFVKRQKTFVTLIIIVLSITFFVIPIIDGLIVKNATGYYFGRVDGELGSFFPLYAAYQILTITGLSLWLIKERKSQSGSRRSQFTFIIFAFAGFGIIPILFSFIFPLFGVLNLTGLDSPSSTIFLFSLAYAIVRHRFLDIRLVITRSLVYGVLLTLVTLSFVFITFLSAQFFGETGAGRAFVSFIVAALIVFGLDPLKRLLSLATDKVFFKAKIDYQAVLRKLSEILSVEINLDRLISALETSLQEELKLKSTMVLLRRKGESERFDAGVEGQAHNPALSLTRESMLMSFLRDKKGTVLLETLERIIEDAPEDKRAPLEAERSELERLGAALVAPVFSQNRMNAILVLGPKLSGDSFSNDDLQLLGVLSPQIGSAIQKANLFEEVRQFGESLKVKVEEATTELKERNVSLVTLQSITKDITRTLDFNKVVQDIADAVTRDLGYVGAILVFLDDDGKTLRARAITNTPLTAKAMKLLPKPFSEYPTDVNDRKVNNLAHRVVKSGQIVYMDEFADVISPPVPRLVADMVQKFIKVKTIVGVPITSEEKTIGVIEVGMRKSQEEVSEREIETIQSLADQLGVVYRNLKLFDQIRKTNEQLEVANKHLQQLDQAKSEFVSIASHQLRTPMTGIMGYLSMMVSGDFGSIDSKHLTILRTLLDESQRMIRLINLFLNVSKIEAGKFTITKNELQLEDVIQREVTELRKIAEDKKLKLVFERPKQPLPKIFADGDKIQDVLLNLIDNAIKYTQKGGVTVSAGEENGGIAVHVKDSGIGIKREDIGELFNKFVRAAGIARIHPDGSGLGLFIAKSIVEGHDGKIWVESEGEGKGSTFSFWLPVSGTAGTTTLKQQI